MKNQPLFTDEQVLALRRQFKAKPFSMRAKARELGVNHVSMANTISGRAYKHVPEAIDPSLFFKGGNQKPSVWVRKPEKPRVRVKTVRAKKENPVVSTMSKKDRLLLIKAAAKRLNL